jgi:transposase
MTALVETKLRHNNEKERSMNKITLIAIDTAKQVFHLVGVDDRGCYGLRRKVSRARLRSTLARLERCEVALEACSASHHWGRCIEELGHRVKLIPPQHVKPYRRGQKNDYRDAEAIVSAALAPGMQFVGIKTVEQQAEQALHRLRSRLQSHRNAAANSLRGLLGEYGVVFPRGLPALREGARGFAETEQAAQLGLLEPILDVLEEMAWLEQRMHDYERRIEARVKTDEISHRLRQELRGVGPLSASALRVKVADVRDFRNGRNFAAYLGMAPGHRGTGGKVSIGKIKPGHDRYLRQLLIHGGRSALRHLGDKQDPQSRWMRAMVQRRGFNIAAVALAHKNARQAWAILAREQQALQ